MLAAVTMIMLLPLPAFGQFDMEKAVLVPLVIPEPLPGAHGSLWTAELYVHNSRSEELQIIFGINEVGGPDMLRVGAGKTEQIDVIPSSYSRNPFSSSNVFLYFPNDEHREAASFSLRVRDLSRQLFTWGTEIPVVRFSEFRTGRLQLFPIPIADRFRQSIRIYLRRDWTMGTPPMTVMMRIYSIPSGELLVAEEVTTRMIASSAPTADFAEVHDLGLQYPILADQLVRVEIDTVDPRQRIWAFATVTNNETQHVTVVTPHRP
jgi:hypothetical protein